MHAEEEVLPDLCVLKCENYLCASAQSIILSALSLPTHVIPTLSVLLKTSSYLKPIQTPSYHSFLWLPFAGKPEAGFPGPTETNSPGKSKTQEGSGGGGVGKSCGLTTHMSHVVNDYVIYTFNNI